MIHMIDWVCSTFILLWRHDFISCYKHHFKLRLLSAELGGSVHRACGSIASLCLERLLSQQSVCSPSTAGSRDCWTSQHPFLALPFGSYMSWVLVLRKDVPSPYGIFFFLNNAWVGYRMWFPLWDLYFSISLSVWWFIPPFPCGSILCFLVPDPTLV